MKNSKSNEDDKQAEILKYRDLVLASIDYFIDHKKMQVKTGDFDSVLHFNELKRQAEEQYQKGKLPKLKQWFRDLAEMPLEEGDIMFGKYLQEKTNYDIDIFAAYFRRVDAVIAKGKITTDNQYYDISAVVDRLCQSELKEMERIEALNKLLAEYEQRKPRRKKIPPI